MLGSVAQALRAQYSGRTEKPVVLAYEGRSGIKNILLDTLRQNRKKSYRLHRLIFLKQATSSTFWKRTGSRALRKKSHRAGSCRERQKRSRAFTPEKNLRELRQVRFVNVENLRLQKRDRYLRGLRLDHLARAWKRARRIIRSRNIAEGLSRSTSSSLELREGALTQLNFCKNVLLFLRTAPSWVRAGTNVSG